MTGRGHFSIQALWKFVLWFKEQRYLVIHARPCGSTMGLEASVFSDPDLQFRLFARSATSFCQLTWVDEDLV
jgi:hypothetical protein